MTGLPTAVGSAPRYKAFPKLGVTTREELARYVP